MEQQRKKVRVLFYSLADSDIVSFYNLNARDIALNLDSACFQCTFFVNRRPDEKLAASRSVRFIRLPSRFGRALMAYELIWGDYDILYGPPTGRMIDLYRALKGIGRPKHIVELAAVSAEQLMATPAENVRRRVRVMLEADGVVAVSPYIAEGFRRQFNVRSRVVPLPVPVEFFRRPQPRTAARPAKVLFVGSMEERKQPHLLLDFAGSISRERAEFHLVGGPTRAPEYVARLITRKDSEKLDHVHFHGSQSQAQVREWLWRSDIFVLPSRLEGTPRVTVEAAAAGLPCIIFDDYQSPTVVNGVTGFQVRTEQEMEQRLQQLVGDVGLRLKMGEAAAEHAKQFDSRIVAKQWEALFLELAAEKA